MVGQTKIIIVTADEDLIREIAFNTSLKAQVIDLDNKQQTTTTTTTVNPNDDQLFRDALDLPQPKKAKTANQTRKKSVDLVCVICGDRAIGFNYDAPTCNSCKAFFRRNAHEPANKIRCLTGRDDCHIDHEMRRKCTSCRLKKCLQMGMRREFVLSKEKGIERQKQLEENRCLTARNALQLSSNGEDATNRVDELLMSNNDDLLSNETSEMVFDTLSVDDWLTMQSVRASFTSYLHLPGVECSDYFDLSNRGSALVSWSQFASKVAARLISFFRQIEDFENLHPDDRFVLIKPINDCCAFNGCNRAEKHAEFFRLCGESSSIRHELITIVISLVHLTDQDPIFISLLLISLLFSRGLSMSEDEPTLQSPMNVNQVQLRYTGLLWKYLANKHGEQKAQKQFIDLLRIIFQLQMLAKRMRNILHTQLTISNTVDKIAPLMQAVLHIS
ncbi:unnamed protein product [Adineta ricciae]|uniref:Nuclear receptor domain-containing protein n=1 Tax=Adineta ricciae TaxID=249248 RepID=A0A814YFL3_ADIRI|nr:unnamed protein product [Adineta ricciae]